MSESNGPYYPSGGGFLPSASQGTQGTPGGGKKLASLSLRPVTIRQILTALQAHSDAEFIIDDVEANQLKVVAQITSIVKQSLNVVYLLEDGTGQIEARYWRDSSKDDEDVEDLVKEHTFVSVLGMVKNFHNKRHFNVQHISPVTDFHEIHFHLLDALNVHLQYTRRAPIPGAGTSASAYAPNAASGVDDARYQDLNPVERAIIETMKKANAGTEGVHVTQIARGVQKILGSADAAAIGDAIDKLCDEDGLLYQAMDDEHYALI